MPKGTMGSSIKQCGKPETDSRRHAKASRQRLPGHHGLYSRALTRARQFCPDQTISAYNWGNQQFPILQPRTSMNLIRRHRTRFPMALGAAVGTDKPTVVVHGDGGFMFHATELATLAQYHLPVIVILCNDSGYGVLRWLQDTRFGRINETDLGK